MVAFIVEVQKIFILIGLYVEVYWRFFVGFIGMCVALYTCGHIIVNRRDYRSALWWVGVVLFAPFIGAFLYYTLGINRIKRKVLSRRQEHHRKLARSKAVLEMRSAPQPPFDMGHLSSLKTVVDKVTQLRLEGGNMIEPYDCGDDAYPAMLQAIREAKISVGLACYIFKNDRLGRQFVEALADAKERGVDVRVLIDDIGSAALGASVGRALRKHKIPVAVFLPTFIPWRMSYINLRNHRKILVVDGRIGFTGSMNIQEDNLLKLHPKDGVQDLQCRIEGPAVKHLSNAFIDDWYFSTEEVLKGEKWLSEPFLAGLMMARGIADGPDEHSQRTRLTFLSAVTSARSSIRIVTPYFVPDLALLMALQVAALSGVNVEIILPEKNDLALVRWASINPIGHALEAGCRVWYTPAPFDHSKIFMIDDKWVLFGSTNWDTRSFRLNFEFNVECYDENLARRIGRIIQGKIEKGREVKLQEITRRTLPLKLRDGIARLFSPYL